jgi:hypothetical protein
MLNVWETPCRELAEAMRKACAEAMPGAELRVRERIKDMLAAEEDLAVPSFRPIGTIYGFCLQVARVHHPFGWRRLRWRSWSTLVDFGMEEMWDAPGWSRSYGLWCRIADPSAGAAVLEPLTAFVRHRDLELYLSETRKDP